MTPETFKSVDEVLDFAIQGEQWSADFYERLALTMEKPWMAEIFQRFAQEELGHRLKLEAVKKGARLKPTEQKIQDLKLADYLVETKDSADPTYQDALVLAMRKEKAAFRLYSKLAETAENEEIKATFEALAQEEAKHKLRIEIEYDDQVLKDN